MKIIDQRLLDKLTAQALTAPRLRKNHNLHPSDEFCCHRLLNAVEPGAYIRPHRHLDPAKDETFVILRGRMGIFVFDDRGTVIDKTVIAAGEEILAVDIPHGVFHTAVSLESGSVFFEAKAGPYHPLREDELAPWAPAEGSEEAAKYLSGLKAQV